MIDWFGKLDVKIQAALIGASVSAVITLLSFGIKDYLIPLIHDKRKKRDDNTKALKVYSAPLMTSTESLCWRFKEIFQNRGGYLLDHSPNNKFNTYKFRSTVYRLCSVLGWIRAVKLELSLTNIDDSSTFGNVTKAIRSVEKSLADGEHMEISLLHSLCNLWNYSLHGKLNELEERKLAIMGENALYESLDKHKVKIAKDLPIEAQKELLLKLSKMLASELKVKENEEKVILELLNSGIAEVSRIEQWIYRDWQSAIGDVMLKEVKDSSKRYSVIGFREFERIVLDEKHPDAIWIKRVEDVFQDLNVTVEDRFDARVKQLKSVYKDSVNLLDELRKVDVGNKIIADKSFIELKNYGKKL